LFSSLYFVFSISVVCNPLLTSISSAIYK
jgi:hypothetical protein